MLSERVLSYSYEGKCSKVSKTLAEDKKSKRQFDLSIRLIKKWWVSVKASKGPLRQEMISLGLTSLIISSSPPSDKLKWKKWWFFIYQKTNIERRHY